MLDTPQFFTMFWNTCAIGPQVLGQGGRSAAWAFSRQWFRGGGAVHAVHRSDADALQVTMVSLLVADAMHWIRLGHHPAGCIQYIPVFIMAKGFDAVPIALLSRVHRFSGPPRHFFHIGVPLGAGHPFGGGTAFEAWNAIEQPMTFLKALGRFRCTCPRSRRKSWPGGGQPCMPSRRCWFGQKYLELGIQASGLNIDNVVYQKKSRPWGPQALERHTGRALKGVTQFFAAMVCTLIARGTAGATLAVVTASPGAESRARLTADSRSPRRGAERWRPRGWCWKNFRSGGGRVEATRLWHS
ncbi:MAG: hypothetical protein ACLR7U_04485 [Ruthenibacterium lactatiformans]